LDSFLQNELSQASQELQQYWYPELRDIKNSAIYCKLSEILLQSDIDHLNTFAKAKENLRNKDFQRFAFNMINSEYFCQLDPQVAILYFATFKFNKHYQAELPTFTIPSSSCPSPPTSTC